MKHILPSAVEFLSDSSNKLRMAKLLMLELPSSGGAPQYAYFTDYHRDINFLGNPFLAGKLKNVSSHKQDRRLTVGSLSFTLSGADTQELLRLVESGVSFIDRSVTVWLAFLDDNGEIIPMDSDTNSAIRYFSGKITSGGVKESGSGDTRSSIITWTCSNMFYDFEQVNGRLTDDATHRGLEVVNGQLIPGSSAKRIEYQEDLGFKHSNQTTSVLAKYTVKEKRYRLKSKRKHFGLSKSYSLQEYYENVTKAIDIDFNLTAKFIPTVYGVHNVDGIPVFADTDLNNPNVVYVVYVFAEGEIDGFLDFSFGDTPIICYDNEDSNLRTCFGRKKEFGDTIHRLASGISTSEPSEHGREYKYNDGNGDIRIWTYHGKSDQKAPQVLVDIAKRKGFYIQNMNKQGAEYFDERFKFLDSAYAVVRYTINENRTDIPEITATLQGKKVAVYNEKGLVSANKTSQNGVWQLLDYLQSPIYGAGVLLSDISIDTAVATAKILDTIDESYRAAWCPYWRYIGWEDQKESNRKVVQLNTVLSGSETVFKNVGGLLESFSGAINNLLGEYRITVEKLDKKPIKINYKETTGEIEIKDITGRTKYNSVQASLVDPAKGWKNNTVTFYNSVFKKQDNNVEKRLNLAFANITNYYCARSMAARELKKSRYARELNIKLPISFLGLEVNDAVLFTYDRYNWKDKYFLVDSISVNNSAMLDVTLREYGEDVFVNSEQVEQGEETPSIDNLVSPPRKFKYVPNNDTTVSTVGKNGSLTWLPSVTSGIIYYTIHQTDKVEPYVINAVGSEMNTPMELDLYNLPAGTYVFEARAVDVNGRRSAPSTITVDINSAKNLSKVDGFKLVNPAPGSFTEWIGKDILVAWDDIPDITTVPNIKYRLEVLHPTTNELIFSSIISNGTKGIYSYTQNRSDYLIREGTIGVYRECILRIRAEGEQGEASVLWTYLND